MSLLLEKREGGHVVLGGEEIWPGWEGGKELKSSDSQQQQRSLPA